MESCGIISSQAADVTDVKPQTLHEIKIDDISGEKRERGITAMENNNYKKKIIINKKRAQ